MLKTSSIRKTEWSIGNEILGICRSILKTHATASLFKIVADILSFLSTYFDDLEIRDRSHFYYKLLTHVSGEKIRSILEDPQITDNEEAGKKIYLFINFKCLCHLLPLNL